ncbi:MAG: hypothetical protein SFV52_08595 [Saprospiraceae bacterium]|nr:hypothetical protein [Saprospiraceae bacterium]
MKDKSSGNYEPLRVILRRNVEVALRLSQYVETGSVYKLFTRQTIQCYHSMKNWQKLLAFAFMIALFVLESCHRGYGCPGTDL